MATQNVQLLPETFKIDPQRFEFQKLPIDKDYIDQIVSSIYLASNSISFAGRNLEKQTLIFRGDYGRRIRNYFESNNILTSTYIFETLSESIETITIQSAETEFQFDPVTKVSKVDPNGVLYKYFFVISFIS